ncbi:DNA terminal protein [Arthrobacter phage Tillums]|nr:DNA terminal protein [Arthrobacter phage Tillums]
MANRELSDKRQQAVQLTGRASKKMSRLKAKNGVIVAGSEFDTRRTPKQIGRMTSRQLDAYMGRLSQFNNRGTQFVPDAKHRPIPAGEFKAYKQAETAHRTHAQQQLDPVRDVKLPGRRETVGERRAQTIQRRKRMAGNPAVNDPYDPRERESTDIASRKALKKLTQDEKRKAQPGWDNKELKRQIGEYGRIVEAAGDAAGALSIKELTPGQFKALWNATSFATEVSTRYEIHQLMTAGKEKPQHAKLLDDAFANAKRLVDWAKKLDL